MNKIFVLLVLLIKICYGANISFFDEKLNHDEKFIEIKNLISKNHLITSSQSYKNALSIKISPIYNLNHSNINYYLLFINSNVDYSLDIIQVFMNDNIISKVIFGYLISNDDLISLTNNYENLNVKCPDEDIEALVGSPVAFQMDDANSAMNEGLSTLKDHAYKTAILLDKDATINNYLNYLSCPKLKVVFSVSHGTNYSVELYDGFLPPIYIDRLLQNKLTNTVVILNSCGAFSSLKPSLTNSLIENAKVQKYISGKTILNRYISVSTSLCILDNILQQSPITNSFKICNWLLDPIDIFGIGGSGKDYLALPSSIR